MLEREGEHMQAAVHADSKLRPWRRSRRIPGRFSRSQFGGEVLDRPLLVGEEEDHVLAAEPLALGRAEGRVDAEPAREHRPRRGSRPGAEQLFAGHAAFAAGLIGHRILLKMSIAFDFWAVE